MKKQRDKKAIEYKSGFQYYYGLAKRYNLFIISISFLMAILSSINNIISLLPSNIILFLNLLWAIISIYMTRIINVNRKKAADLQEFYDIYIFNIDKNEKIMYPKEEKYEIKNCIKFDEQEYYNIPTEEIKITDIYCIQRNNIIYDKDMRKNYKKINYIYGIIYLSILFLISTVSNLNIYELAVTIILPSIYIISYIINNIYNLIDEINIINEIEFSIDSIISLSNRMTSDENTIEVRKFQDFIYLKRRNWIMIPNWIYKRYLYKKIRDIL